MGHRALVAYERADGLYNVHYSHWGAANLQLKVQISAVTPFGGENTDPELASNFKVALAGGIETDEIDGNLSVPNPKRTLVDLKPIGVGCSREEIITKYLDFLHHEAYYEVSRDFEVKAYRTLWFGLQYECDAVDEGETVGNGALTTVRWYDGEPVGDGYLRGQFQGMKDIVGDMIDRGVFSETMARRYMMEKLAEWIDERHDLIIPNVEAFNSKSSG